MELCIAGMDPTLEVILFGRFWTTLSGRRDLVNALGFSMLILITVLSGYPNPLSPGLKTFFSTKTGEITQ